MSRLPVRLGYSAHRSGLVARRCGGGRAACAGCERWRPVAIRCGRPQSRGGTSRSSSRRPGSVRTPARRSGRGACSRRGPGDGASAGRRARWPGAGPGSGAAVECGRSAGRGLWPAARALSSHRHRATPQPARPWADPPARPGASAPAAAEPDYWMGEWLGAGSRIAGVSLAGPGRNPLRRYPRSGLSCRPDVRPGVGRARSRIRLFDAAAPTRLAIKGGIIAGQRGGLGKARFRSLPKP